MKFLLLSASIILCLAVTSSAQGLETTPGSQTGREPFSSYFDAGIDSINLYNGNLFLDLTLFSRSGRELSTGLRLTYNSQKWQPQYCTIYECAWYSGGWTVSDIIGEFMGFTYEVQNSCGQGGNTFNLYATWVDGLGTKHRYYAPSSDCNNPPAYTNATYQALDGDASQLIVGNSTSDVRIKFKDGRILDFGHTAASPINGRPAVFTPNGNYCPVPDVRNSLTGV